MHKFGIIGHYGFGIDLANGQTIKTKTVTNAIRENIDDDIICVDAHGGKRAIIPVVIGCIKAEFTCKNIVIMLTENGLRVTVPLLSLLNKLFKRKLHYIVIGGWLPKFLKARKGVFHHLKSFHFIYVETETMAHSLNNLGLNNVVVMPNCKELKIIKEKELIFNVNEPLKLCTFSRVMKEKGIEDAINAVSQINKGRGRVVYSLDIYGEIDSEQKEWFSKLKSGFPEYVKYKGVVQYNNTVDTLKNYFALLFPTRFYTEGVPGTIIDAYAAGIPVISSKWENYKDVVEENVTGVGYEFGDFNDLVKVMTQHLQKPNELQKLKTNCRKRAKKYTIENMINILFECIENK